MIFPILLALTLAIEIDLQNESKVREATSKIANNLIAYYTPNNSENGAISENSATTMQGMAWYESGMMWDIMMEYSRVSGIDTHSTIVTNALTLASAGKKGDFLGENPAFSESWLGRWNDDILWFALASMTGAELYGINATMPGGIEYYKLTQNTYSSVWEFWDNECGGGFYWSRNGKYDQDGYKSTITNGLQLMVASRLGLISRNNTLIAQADQIYTWLKSKVISKDWNVGDGVVAAAKCRVNKNQYSYLNGMIMGGLSFLYKATGNEKYIADANNLATFALKTFTKSKIITDTCEPFKCQDHRENPKGTLIRGLSHVYEFTNDLKLKEEIKSVFKTSVDGMLKTCDQDFKCSVFWSGENSNIKNGFHSDMVNLELMTAYSKTFGINAKNMKVPTSPPPVKTKAYPQTTKATTIASRTLSTTLSTSTPNSCLGVNIPIWSIILLFL